MGVFLFLQSFEVVPVNREIAAVSGSGIQSSAFR
jgi:hypothetical protein